MNWELKRINNKNSKYDFRIIPSKKRDYSEVNFFEASYFRQLVSISSYLTNGIIKCKDKFYKVNGKNKNEPVIFNFSIDQINKNYKNQMYSTIDKYNNIEVNLYGINYKIKSISKPNTKIFNSLFETKNINNLHTFFEKNKSTYSNVIKSENNLYIVTAHSTDNNMILDLVSDKNRLTRYKVQDLKMKYMKDGYYLLLIDFEKNMKPNITFSLPITFDEYLTYIYDLMLPYKFDFNDISKKINKKEYVDYKKKGIMKYAFAIDPNGSRDRDDAISSFYLNNNNVVNNLNEATHIHLMVHISNTLPFIVPKDDNYYYHFSKFKCNTDYLDTKNLPMMDRILSEKMLSLDGKGKDAITIEMTYKIKNKEKFVIYPFPENVSVHQSKNLEIFGTTYSTFADSFSEKSKYGFCNDNFNLRYIINCNKIVRDFNMFVYEGESILKDKRQRMIANNLKQLYIFFVNSLNHTGKDSLLKVPNDLMRKNDNIYLDFDPIDMWSHSLVEYTALESNIYFAHLMYMIPRSNKYKNLEYDNGSYNFNYEDILFNIENLGNKNTNNLLKNINISPNKKLKSKSVGIFRNLFAPSLDQETYINDKIAKMLKVNNKENLKNIIEYLLKKHNYMIVDGHISNNFLKLLLGLRQIHLLIKSKSNLDISSRLIEPELKMKARYEGFPFWHIDIATYFYTHATSPMRRFIDINVHHFIFNPKYQKYIMRNLDFDGVNMSVQAGKSIHHLVNNTRFIEFIKINNPTLTFMNINSRKSIYGFKEIINFYNFNKTKTKNGKKVKIIFDNFGIPKIVNSNSKVFNLYKHMILSFDKDKRKLIKDFLDIILQVKSVKKICN